MFVVVEAAIAIEQFVEREIEKLGAWIKPHLTEAENLYNTLTDFEKQAAQYAYGVIAIFNANLDKVDSILPLIRSQFPGLSTDVLHGFIETLLNKINAVQGSVPLTLEDAITALVSHLKGLEGDGWAEISQAAGNILTRLLSPDTPLQKVKAIAEFVYQIILKPNLKLAA